MPQVHYPFIDIAVHPAVRAHFAAGEAVVLFSRDMGDVLWANGEGARLLGHRAIYDLIEGGPERGGVAFRQLAAAAAQLSQPGDRRGFVMRINSGFMSTAVQADVNLITVGHDQAVMFSAAAAQGKAGLHGLLSGFDDPDTHMAVLGGDGEVLAASAGFQHLGIMADTARALIVATARSADGVVKRPIPSGSGYLPAAIGRLSDDLYLLFCVETSIGRMDAPDNRQEDPVVAADAAAPFPQAPAIETSPAEEPGTGDGGAVVDAELSLVTDAQVVDALSLVDEPAEPSEFMAANADSEIEFDADPAEADTLAEVEDSNLPETEEGAAEADLADLAIIDGASVEEIAAASGEDPVEAPAADGVPLLETDAQGDTRIETPAQLDADRAEAPDAEHATTRPDVDSPELAADIVAASDVADEAPEEFAQAQAESEQLAASDAAPLPANEHDEEPAGATDGGTQVDHDLETGLAGEGIADHGGGPTEADADRVANSSDEDIASLPDIDPPALAADRADASDTPLDAPEDEPAPSEENVAAAPEIAAPPEPTDMVASQEDQPFRFNRGGRPVRFVWKLDANGVFAEVSDEFARAVGPHSGAIVGQSFRDLAALFDLDREQQISGLLERRDTWSGRTIKWPVEGTDLMVPVDLAALPTYSRNREFDGFRGFGIIRIGDAETDPHGFGLTMSPETATEGSPAQSAQSEETGIDASTMHSDEFRGEVPALDITSNPLANFSDKVIQLEERRARTTRDGLSVSEQAALREIARQLEPFGKRPNEDVLKSSSGLLQTEDADDAAGQRLDAALSRDGEPEVHASDDDDGAPAESNDSDRLDEQRVQTLFEDLGTGPGLTPYAIDQVPMAILIHAGDRLIEANSEFRRLTGFDTIAELERKGGLDALITRREGPDAGVYLVRADGTQVLVSARLQSVRYEGSSALMLALTPAAGTLAAVTTEPQIIAESDSARKLAALSVEVDELHSILETATDGVIVLDTEGRVRSMNRSASALFNFDDAEARGRPFAMLFAHESQKSVQDYLAGLVGHGVASVLNDGREVIGREASGGFIPLFMTMGRMPGSNSYCAVIRDITQWKRSEEELRTAKRAAETANQHKSDFLARVSHEIRTPLNAIIGFSDMIANEHFGPAGHSRYVEYASDIGRSGRHVLDIVNDLLDISKIEAGEMDLDFAAVGINDCISEAVLLVQPQANAQRVIIRTSLSQSVPNVVADLRSIKQIALNILANAIRYTPSGGQIVVSTAYESSGSVTLRIRDTGVGMSKGELDQAMKPFGQVSSGTRQRGDGTGLGLPLTKAMTEANRATFAIHSAPNEGTLVEITFPPQRVLAD